MKSFLHRMIIECNIEVDEEIAHRGRIVLAPTRPLADCLSARPSWLPCLLKICRAIGEAEAGSAARRHAADSQFKAGYDPAAPRYHSRNGAKPIGCTRG